MENKKSKAVIFANIIFCSTAILFFLAILYMWYRSNSLQIPFNLKFGAFLVAGLFCSVLALYVRDDWKVNLAIVLLSTIVSVYSVESLLFVSDTYQVAQIEKQQGEIDRRSKLEVIEDLRSEGDDAWPLVLSWLFAKSNGLQSGQNRIFPLGGISQKTTVYCNESGQYKIFESDEHGFNNPKGLYRIGAMKTALVGDSFTIGSCVMSEQDIASQLRSMGITALNLGNGGNGPLIELAGLKEYAEQLQPEVVLWFYYEGNDLTDLEHERNAPMLMSYLEDDNYSQNLVERQNEVDAAMIKYVNSQWEKVMHLHRTGHQQEYEVETNKNGEFRKIIKLGHLRSRLGFLNPQKKPEQHRKTVMALKNNLSLFSEIIAAADDRTSRWDGKFYFVYLPTLLRYVNNNDEGSFYGRDDVLAAIHGSGISLIDFHEVISRHPNPSSLTPYLGGHYNAEGYRLVAELIAGRLRKDGLIKEAP